MVDTRYEKQDVEEKTFTVKTGSLSGGGPACHAEARLVRNRALGQGCKGQGKLHPHDLLFDGVGGDPLGTLG